MKNFDNIVVLQLNEANFNLIEKYKNTISKCKNLKKILESKKIFTDDNDPYNFQEPWIKWMSFYLGVNSNSHKVYRLGHGQPKKYESIFKNLELLDFNIGILMSMNYKNDLKNNNFFISDPWTSTDEKIPKEYKSFIKCIKRNILSNSEKKISNKDKLILLYNLLKLFPITDYFILFTSIIKSFKKPWIKALLLDCALANLFIKLNKKVNKRANFIFLNSIAHIQHRYILNSKKIVSKITNPEWLINKHDDPIEDSIFYLEYILSKIIFNNQFIVLNGFSQVPYDRIKYYWRIKNLSSFFSSINLDFVSIYQKMTRDFEIHFDSYDKLLNAKLVIENAICKKNNKKIFSDITIKEHSLFASLSYPYEINENDIILINGKNFKFKDCVSFVAIKNAMHSSKGVVYFSERFSQNMQKDIFNQTYNISDLKNLIIDTIENKKIINEK